MKQLTAILIMVLFVGGLSAQNITNTLPSSGNFIIKDATNTFFTLKQNTGNVGIGSNTFDAVNPEKLLIDCGTTTSVNAIYAKGSINDYFQFNIQNLSNGTHASSDIVATANNGTETTNFIDLGINGSNYTYTTGNPILTGKANDGYLLSSGKDFYLVNNSVGDDIIFLVGGTDTTKQVMRLFSNGNVSVGSAYNASYKFQVRISPSVEGHVKSDGGWTSSSDIRIKKNINPIKNALEYIMNLNPVRYDLKTEEDSKTGNHFGFIAQELEKYLPEFVDTDSEGMKSIEYANLTSILAGAVKEQQVQINDLNARLTALEKKSGVTQNAGIGGSENSNTGMWIFLSVVVLSGAGFMMRRNKQ